MNREFEVGCVLIDEGGLDERGDLMRGGWWKEDFFDDARGDSGVALISFYILRENIFHQIFFCFLYDFSSVRFWWLGIIGPLGRLRRLFILFALWGFFRLLFLLLLVVFIFRLRHPFSK